MKYLSVILFLLACNLGLAQGLQVKGKILDGAYEGHPLAFAEVKVKDLDMSVETDIDGSYQLNLMKGRYTLIVDFIGYESIEIEDVVVSDSNISLSPIRLETARLEADMLLASKEE